ncbi:bifunctional hydroxymethylpyrimidine kinase/phosphomethylpyrimidine kinase [Sulfolobales archaeon HS-7]|nr:bifunctional hydroxymethylpyrimidine kinase/phosphomethylpyrimidine kinase [Sulfolobales archaeon HS-7]
MDKDVVLTIGGFDTGNGAGVESDLKTLESIGVHGIGVQTAITFQNSLGIRGIFPIPEEVLAKQIEVLKEDFDFPYAKTGMIYTGGQARIVRQLLTDKKFVVDPVIIAKDGTTLIKDFDEYTKYIVKDSLAITPNVPEAEKLTGVRITDVDTMKVAARKIYDVFNVRNIIIKGGHLPLNEVVDILFTEEEVVEFRHKRSIRNTVHGTGSALASYLAGFLAQGYSVKDGLRKSIELMEIGIEFSKTPGLGNSVFQPLAHLHRERARWKTYVNMLEIDNFVANKRGFYKLIPEVQSNIAHASDPRYVIDLCDIATFKGRITKYGDDQVKVNNPPVFCRTTHTARLLHSLIGNGINAVILMNIRFDEGILEAFRKLGYVPLEINREEEPSGPEGGTMAWIGKIVANSQSLSNVIFDRGMKGKEAMIRFWERDVDKFLKTLNSVVEMI